MVSVFLCYPYKRIKFTYSIYADKEVTAHKAVSEIKIQSIKA